MYVIVVEIQGYGLLQKTRPEKMTELIRMITTKTGSEPAASSGNYSMYVCRTELRNLVEIINAVSSILNNCSFLHATNILADVLDEHAETGLSEYSQLIRKYVGLNQICVSADCAARIMEQDLGECVKSGNGTVWRLEHIHARPHTSKKVDTSFYSVFMNECITSSDSSRFFIHTADETSSMLLARNIPESLSIVFNENHTACFKSFLHMEAPVHTDVIREYLVPEDRAILERTDRLLRHSEYIWNPGDVFLRFSVLLRGYTKYFASRKAHPALHILNAHQMNDRQKEMTLRLLQQKDFSDNYRLFVYGTEDTDESFIQELQAERRKAENDPEIISAEDWLEAHSGETGRTVFYSCIALRNMMTISEVAKNVSSVFGFSRKHVMQQIEELKNDRIFFGNLYLYFPGESVIVESRSDLFLKRETLVHLGQAVYSQWNGGILSYETLKLLFAWNPQQVKLSCLLEIALHLLRHRLFEQLESFFEFLYVHAPDLPDLDLLNELIRMKKHMVRNERAEAEKIFRKLVFFDDFQSILYGHIRLAIGEFYYNSAKYPECLDVAKKLVFHSQEFVLPFLEAPANMLIGYSMLKLGKNNEALEYFGIAVEEAKNSMYPGDYTYALLSRSISLFLKGNYSMAIRFSESAFTSSENEGLVSLKIFCKFICGRSHFIVGHYDRALLLFQESLVEASLNACEVWEGLLKLWMGRCYCYMGQFDRAFKMIGNMPETAESLFFLAECHFFFDHLKEAREYAHRAMEISEELLPEPNHYLVFSPVHGFFDIEGRACANPHVILQRVIMSFWAYLENKGATNTSGLEIFEELLKTGNLIDNDPYLYFYYQCYSLTDKLQQHDDVLEYLTILSKGIRHIQGIASRIDDVDERLSYLNKAYWTSKMISSGKVHKLT